MDEISHKWEISHQLRTPGLELIETSVATGVNHVNIRLLLFSTSDFYIAV